MEFEIPDTGRALDENENDVEKATANIDALIETRNDLPREVRLELIDIARAMRMQTSVVKFLKKRIELREETIQRIKQQQ